MAKGTLVSADQLKNALATVNCDKDEEGYITRGKPGAVSFLGAGREYLVDETLQAKVGNAWVPVLPQLLPEHRGYVVIF